MKDFSGIKIYVGSLTSYFDHFGNSVIFSHHIRHQMINNLRLSVYGRIKPLIIFFPLYYNCQNRSGEVVHLQKYKVFFVAISVACLDLLHVFSFFKDISNHFQTAPNVGIIIEIYPTAFSPSPDNDVWLSGHFCYLAPMFFLSKFQLVIC